MVSLSITGVFYILLSFGLAVFAHRVFNYWQSKKNNQFSQAFFYFFVVFSVASFVIGWQSLLGHNSDLAKLLALARDILFSIGCLFLAYLILRIKFPKTNPCFGVVPIAILGLSVTVLNFYQGQPVITQTGGVDLGLTPMGNLLLFLLFLITFVPMGIILFNQSRTSKSNFLQTKLFSFSMVAFGGFTLALIESILEPFLNLEETLLNEYALMILTGIVFAFLYFTRNKLQTWQ